MKKLIKISILSIFVFIDISIFSKKPTSSITNCLLMPISMRCIKGGTTVLLREVIT